MSGIMQRRDQTPIFGAIAPSYYAKGLPVIPLVYHEKKPIPNDWSRFHDSLPTPEEQAAWAGAYFNCNVGLVLGEQSGITAIDIDTPNEDLVRKILGVLPRSPWTRVGAKGMVMAYRWNNVPTFRIKDVTGAMLVEHLASRTQIVLPPSIHPTTQRPYQASCDLLEVMNDLPLLPKDIEGILREMFKDNGVELSHSGWTRVTDWTPAGARDVKMTAVAGHYANGVVRGERPLLEAIELMKGWFASSVEKVAGDDINIDKGIQNLVKFVVRDVIEKKKVLPKGWDEGLTPEMKEQMGLQFTDDNEEWSADQVKDYLQRIFENNPPDSMHRINGIDYVLNKIARSKNLTTLDEERIMRFISDAEGAGSKLSVATLRKRLKELSAGELMGEDHTEIAKAVISDMEQYAPVRYNAEKFWTYNGSHWVEKPRQEILKIIADNYGSYSAAKKNSDHSGILRTIATLLPQNLKTIEASGVNFANGVVMLDGSVYPHDMGYGFTYTMPFRYMPHESHKCDKFMDFLHRCWGADEDFEDKVQALQEALCVTIFGLGPKFQRVVLLYGAAKSGKSQLLRIVSSLVPDNARSVCPPDQWGDKFAPTSMHQKLLNVCGELSEKRTIDGQKFKEIVDGNEIQMQYKGGQLFMAPTYATHWFASNHLPRTEDTSEGFNRRWLIFTFTRPVKADERVLDLGEKIVAEEREAIAAWAIEALPRLLKNNEFTLPSSHWQQMREVANMNNSVRFFLQESGRIKVLQPGSSEKNQTSGQAENWKTLPHISEMKLHNVYYSFCLGPGGAKPVGPRMFRMKMRELAPEMGFKIVIIDTGNGAQDCVYQYLTLVDAKAA